MTPTRIPQLASFKVISNLSKNLWKKDKTIEIIDRNASLSNILKSAGSPILQKIVGEPKEEDEMKTPATRWLREEKGCKIVRKEIPVAGKTAD